MTESVFHKKNKTHCIVVFKSRRRWSAHLEDKLRLKYQVLIIEAFPVIVESGYSGLLRKIDESINEYGSKLIFFSADFFYGIDVEFINSVSNRVFKVLVTLDDISLHEFNSINALACNLVVSADPVSVLKYEEKKICSEYIALESSKQLYRNLGLPKTIDVLFYGNCRLPHRKYLLDYLQESGINLEIFGEDSTYLSQKDLVTVINRAKLVINVSETGYLKQEPAYRGLFATLSQFKGRIIEVGLCGTACISEYSPGVRLMFTVAEVVTFRTRQECLEEIKRVLADDNLRARLASNLYEKCVSHYEDVPIMNRIANRIEQIQVFGRSKTESEFEATQEIPFWYRRLVLRSRVQCLIKNKSVLLTEVLAQVRSKKIAGIVKIILAIDLLCWIPYHLLRRICAARVVK